MKATLAIALAVFGGTILHSSLALATCEAMSGQTIPGGEGRAGISSGNSWGEYANAYHGGSSDELNLGGFRTIGYLVPGQSYNLGFAAAAGDQSGSFCMQVTIRARLSAWQGQSCGGHKQGGDWLSSYVVNTCGLPDLVFRGQKTLTFFALGNAASMKTNVEIVDPSGTITSQDPGCYEVATSVGSCID